MTTAAANDEDVATEHGAADDEDLDLEGVTEEAEAGDGAYAADKAEGFWSNPRNRWLVGGLVLVVVFMIVVQPFKSDGGSDDGDGGTSTTLPSVDALAGLPELSPMTAFIIKDPTSNAKTATARVQLGNQIQGILAQYPGRQCDIYWGIVNGRMVPEIAKDPSRANFNLANAITEAAREAPDEVTIDRSVAIRVIQVLQGTAIGQLPSAKSPVAIFAGTCAELDRTIPPADLAAELDPGGAVTATTAPGAATTTSVAPARPILSGQG